MQREVEIMYWVYVCLDVHGARCICTSSTVFSRIRAAALI